MFTNEKWSVPFDMDTECIDLCVALNSLPGIETVNSCCGHGKQPYWIWFDVDYSQRGLLTLSRLTSINYYPRISRKWKIFVDHRDTFPQLTYRLEGPKGKDGYESSKEFASLIMEMVNDTTSGYNILLQR